MIIVHNSPLDSSEFLPMHRNRGGAVASRVSLTRTLLYPRQPVGGAWALWVGQPVGGAWTPPACGRSHGLHCVAVSQNPALRPVDMMAELPMLIMRSFWILSIRFNNWAFAYPESLLLENNKMLKSSLWILCQLSGSTYVYSVYSWVPPGGIPWYESDFIGFSSILLAKQCHVLYSREPASVVLQIYFCAKLVPDFTRECGNWGVSGCEIRFKK